jgi:hypothetical protein
MGLWSAVVDSALTVRKLPSEFEIAADRWVPALWQPTAEMIKQIARSDWKTVPDEVIRNPERKFELRLHHVVNSFMQNFRFRLLR